MPYYGYGYGYGYGDAGAQSVYLMLLIPVLLLSLWAQGQVSGNFKRFSKVANARRISGAKAAELVLRANGVSGVKIMRCSGTLSDHYDPRSNTIFLSNGVYDAATIAAVGVAAHEAGHAVQYAVGYFPIRIRAAIIPITQFGSKFSFVALMLGLVMYSQTFLFAGIVLFSLTTVFQLVTLPVEFNASARAIETLEGDGILVDADELRGAKKVLRAAALTYVAALLMSFVQMLRYVLIFAGRANRRGGDR